MSRRIFKWSLIFTILIIVSYLLTIVFYPIPNVNHPYESIIVSKEDKFLYSKIKEETGTYIKLENVSESFLNTLILIEDQNFYSHNGVDYKRIISSTITNIKNRKIVEGGSTITQQLSRMIYLNNDKTFKRKFKELLISKKFEANYKKEKILEMYINLAFFGHNLYGIQSASQYYFNKNPAFLDYNESAILVGIINSPNNYAPDINLDKCIAKKNIILTKLFENKLLDEENYSYYLETTPNLYYNSNTDSLIYDYYHDAIKKELSTLNLNLDSNDKLGTKITTYLDMEIQEKVYNIVKNYQSQITNN